MQEFIDRCRKWQKDNPDWELICDMDGTDHLYVQWHELSNRERMSWVGKYRSEAKDAFEEFGTKRCKVERMVLDKDMKLHYLNDWPHGYAMTVFKTSQLP